jgi:hypothetical protein
MSVTLAAAAALLLDAGFDELEQPAAASAQALIIPVIRRTLWRRVVRFMSGRLHQRGNCGVSEK